MKDELKTGMELSKDAGCSNYVDARPDLKPHLEAHLTTISTPKMTEEGDKEPGRGPLPPKDEGGPMDAHPWKPKGRK